MGFAHQFIGVGFTQSEELKGNAAKQIEHFQIVNDCRIERLLGDFQLAK